MVATAKSFAIATAIDVAVGVVCFIVFCILRRQHHWRRYYTPKRCGSLASHASKRHDCVQSMCYGARRPSILWWVGTAAPRHLLYMSRLLV